MRRAGARWCNEKALGGRWLRFGGKQMRGDLAEFPDYTKPGENLEGVVGDVDFPPEEALACGGHVVMVIVVPAFAERENGKKPIVAAAVSGLVAPGTEKVRKRVDGEGVVPEEHGAEAESPNQERPATDQPEDDRQGGRRNHVVLVEPAQLRKLGEVADVFKARVIVLVRNNPADVRPEEPEKRRRVQIIFLIRKAVVMPVVRGPPKNSLLRGRLRHERNYELKRAARFVRTMRKIPVIAGCNEKHPHDKNRQTRDQIRPAKRKKENAERQEVNRRKRNRLKNRNARAVRQENQPIARERSHPACSSVEFTKARNSAGAETRHQFSV